LKGRGIDQTRCIELYKERIDIKKIEIPGETRMYLVSSGQKAERPLNLVVRRDEILDLIPQRAKVLWDQ